jgi:hypothetical protein
MNQMNLINLLAETTTEPILEVIGFILVFGSFALAVFFVYQLVYYSIALCKILFGPTQKSKSKNIMQSPLVSVPVALLVGGIVLYLLAAYNVIDVSAIIDGITNWFNIVFTK